MFSDFLLDVGNYEQRKLGRDQVNGIEVSTVFSSDEGYETAIIDENGAHPVERYGNKEEAKEGHKRWCEAAKTIKEITKLGWSDIGPDDEVITIVRSSLLKKS